ncbi:hypothetical protein HQ602_17195 [Rhodococcus kroppenstedtii]|uniref:hypothetical protein n=1 Tax=Rhodococcoides kroppenstedtii TaxID=293050 RepID=UPI001C9B6700|nr:hypothetical protein [Rhodococcus kroppenstedtii]MBY6438112.1 hypothetical protein [Rhodococcus kroppenstedtii]
MTQPDDTVGTDVSRSMRTALQAALVLGEAFARAREVRLRDAARASEANARALQSRYRAERRSAEAQLRGAHSPMWWEAATAGVIADTYRTAHAWREQSPLAESTVGVLDKQLAARYRIDTAALGAAPTDVAAEVGRILADREQSAAAAQPYSDRGFTVVEDRPFGRDFIPTWDLRQADGTAVDQHTIDSDPKNWAVHLGRDDSGNLVPEFFCTDPDAAGLNRPAPPLYLVYEDWWWEMAAEHQIVEAHEQLVGEGAAAGVARVRDEISRRYGVDARPLAGLPDELHAQLVAVVAARQSAAARTDQSVDAQRRAAEAAVESDERGVGRAAVVASATSTAMREVELASAVDWAKNAIPRDAERYVYGTGEKKDAARETVTAAWELAQAKQWATDQAPTLAVALADTERRPSREDYLAARDTLVSEWDSAGRPTTELTTTLPAGRVAARVYDSEERRAALRAHLEAAGVEPDAVTARLAADRDNAHPIGGTNTAPAAMTASKGDRSGSRGVGQERGDR